MYPAQLQPLLEPSRLYSRAEILASPSPVPAEPGLYAWYFRRLPGPVTAEHCITRDGLHLLYAGISPKAPPANGAKPSSQTIRSRLRYHMRGNAFGSTLRLTLGCLLADELGIQLRRVGSGTRLTFADGEHTLSDWLHQNALVCWVTTPEPWVVEEEMIRTVPLPLNLDQNAAHPFHATLSRLRSEAKRRARELPVVAG